MRRLVLRAIRRLLLATERRLDPSRGTSLAAIETNGLAATFIRRKLMALKVSDTGYTCMSISSG